MNQVEEMADRMLMISKGKQKLYGPVDDIRGEYALHAIVVEGEGEWTALAGVDRIQHNGRRDGVLLHLKPEATVDSVLEAIARADNIRIERFERAIPSLEEIFIRAAGEAVHES